MMTTCCACKRSPRRSSHVAQIDSFVQRCHNLQEVCEGQKQFARRGPGGVTADLPVFGGAHGSEVATQILMIQSTYEKEISRLRCVDGH
jgi:dynein heavy chain